MIGNHESIDVFIGLDVGKGEHHAVALGRSGKKLHAEHGDHYDEH